MTQDQMTAARQFIDAIPHSRRLGMQLEELGDGRAIISMPYDSALIGGGGASSCGAGHGHFGFTH